MPHQYADEISRIANCPSAASKPIAIDAYRFVHDSLTHPNNFMPVAKISPARRFATSETRCSAHALSFFLSLENSIARFRQLEKNNKLLRKTLGNRVAKVSLTDSDGVVFPPQPTNHFDLHPDAGVEFLARCIIVKHLD